jgi:hypothetical protein
LRLVFLTAIDSLIGLALFTVGATVFIAATLRVRSPRRDRLIEMQAKAAQRGDQAFLDNPFRR